MKQNNSLFPVSHYSFRCLFYIFAATLLLFLVGCHTLAILLLIMSIYIGYIFRNPERELPIFEDKSVIAPVDGEITLIEELDDEHYLYKITVQSGLLDVGILRAPTTSKVVSFQKVHGTRLCATSKLGAKLNENATIVFEDKHHNKTKLVHTLKQSICSIGLKNIADQEILQSVRYGVMVHGCTVMYLPHNFRLNITVGQKIYASETLIGYFS